MLINLLCAKMFGTAEPVTQFGEETRACCRARNRKDLNAKSIKQPYQPMNRSILLGELIVRETFDPTSVNRQGLFIPPNSARNSPSVEYLWSRPSDSYFSQTTATTNTPGMLPLLPLPLYFTMTATTPIYSYSCSYSCCYHLCGFKQDVRVHIEWDEV